MNTTNFSNTNTHNPIFHHSKFSIEICDSFIWVIFKECIYLETQDTQDMYDILIKIYEKDKKKLHLLLDVNGVIGTPKSSRDLGISPVAIEITQKLVLLTDSMISKIMANFFLKITPPPYPVRIVNTFNEGFMWLQKSQ